MNENEKSPPPYVPWPTFRSLIDDLREHTPKRIDRSVVGNKRSWADATKLLSSLRFLRLIDEQGNISETFREYLTADAPQSANILRHILTAAYDPVISPDELQDMTPQLFEERFAIWGRGDTIRKARKFFLEAAKAADVALSPRLVTRASPTRRPTPKNAPPKTVTSRVSGKPAHHEIAGDGNGAMSQAEIDDHDADLYQRVLDRFRAKPDGFEHWLEGRLELLRERAGSNDNG